MEEKVGRTSGRKTSQKVEVDTSFKKVEIIKKRKSTDTTMCSVITGSGNLVFGKAIN